jgi:hypothetical protein
MLTPQADLRVAIIRALGRLGGAASRFDILNTLEASLAERLTDEDLEPVESRPFEEKWRNRASYERAQMVRDGLLVRRNGVWELDTGGRAFLESLGR